MACSTGCPTQDHKSYGDCLRGKSLQIDKHALAHDMRGEARHTRALNDYRELREAGSLPTSPRWDHVETAKREAMKTGVFRDES
jgi:hypothetical protein